MITPLCHNFFITIISPLLSIFIAYREQHNEAFKNKRISRRYFAKILGAKEMILNKRTKFLNSFFYKKFTLVIDLTELFNSHVCHIRDS